MTKRHQCFYCGYKQQHHQCCCRLKLLSLVAVALLQVTPNYQKQVSADGIEDNYPIYNKPLGIDYWLNDKGRDLDPSTVVVMMDTDQLIGLPLDSAFRDTEGRSVVRDGTPAGQIYLIGGGWFDTHNCIDMMRAECGDSCVDTSSQAAREHYMVGAPYAMTKADWLRLTPLWTKYTLRVRPVSKGWADDMFGYCLAAMHLGLRHATTTALMLSAPANNKSEAWHLIDGMDPSGRASRWPSSRGTTSPSSAAPASRPRSCTTARPTSWSATTRRCSQTGSCGSASTSSRRPRSGRPTAPRCPSTPTTTASSWRSRATPR